MKRIFFAFFALGLLISGSARADSIMFMDEGGNIHFVERISDVPMKYRNQLRKAPTPVPDPKTLRKIEAEQIKEQRRKEMENRKAEADRKKKEAMEEKERLRQENLKARAAKNKPATTSPPQPRQ